MLIAAIVVSAILGWSFGYFYAAQSIKTQVMRSYNVTVSTLPALRRIK